MKLCKDCYYFEDSPRHYQKCKNDACFEFVNPKWISPVTGRTEFRSGSLNSAYCDNSRCDSAPCGPDAKLFKPKELA